MDLTPSSRGQAGVPRTPAFNLSSHRHHEKKKDQPFGWSLFIESGGDRIEKNESDSPVDCRATPVSTALLPYEVPGGHRTSSPAPKEKTDLRNSILRTTVRYDMVLERLEVRDYETGQCGEEWQESQNTSDQ